MEVYFPWVDWIKNCVFGANFFFKQLAYQNDERTQGKKSRKLTLKSSVAGKQTLNCKIDYTYGKNLEQKSVLK